MGKNSTWILAVLLTLILRTWLLLRAAVPFNGDEAVVALMARHITQGAAPLFFYGQSYMGSLDAYLVAAGFSLFGEAIWVIRAVQMLLYAAFLGTGWLLARRLLVDSRAAGMAVLVMAIPPVMVTTYTAATLGGYGESLVFGNLILLLGYEVVYGDWREKTAAWIGLGLVGGLAFWTLGLSGVYLLPVGIAGLANLRRLKPGLVLLAAAAFVVGSSPWWFENIRNDWAAMEFLLGRSELKLPTPAIGERLIGYFFLGLPTLFGLRRPWEAGYEPAWLAALGLFWMLSLLVFTVEVRRKKLQVFRPGAGSLLFWLVLGFTAIFLGTQFSIDSTGRYFIPLYPVFSVATGAFAGFINRRYSGLGWGLVGLVLVFNFTCVYRAAVQPEGLTTQFGPESRFNNDYDQQLIDFLSENELSRGYSNYWVSFRLAFLSGETLIYAPRLPYKADLSYTINDNRYPAYDQAVSAAERPAYITILNPALDQALETAFASGGIVFREQWIGPYHLYYALSETVRPESFDFIHSPSLRGTE